MKVREKDLFKLIMFCVAFTVVIFYSLHWNSEPFFASNQSSLHHQLILLTYMRSGSTFVGALIGSHPDVFYMYEPLWTLRRAYDGWTLLRYLDGGTQSINGLQSIYRTKGEETVNNIFNCQLHLLDLGVLTNQHMYRSPTTEDYALCLNISQNFNLGLSKELISQVSHCLHLLRVPCLRAKVRFVKVIEGSMSQVITMMKSQPHVKVIHLIRDPRAVLNSRKEFQLYTASSLARYAKKLCRRITRDLEITRLHSQLLPGQIITLRYEDIVSSPIVLAQQLYRFVDVDIGPEFLQLVWNMTYAGFPDGCNVCPVRGNATVTANRWREKLGFDEVVLIQEQCRRLVDTMGYRQFNTEKHLKDVYTSSTYQDYDPKLPKFPNNL